MPALRAALADADGLSLGQISDRSQQLTASHLRNTLEETEWLPARARSLGAVAASAFGAGFGGSVWALVTAAQAPRFASAWEAAYAEAFPERVMTSRFFVMPTPAPGACSVV